MNCKDFKKLKDRYLHEEISAEEEQAIEAHIEKCEDCQKLLDSWLIEGDNEREEKKIVSKKSLQKTTISESLSEQKQKRILRQAKYKNRFSMAMFLLALFILFQIIGSMLSSLFFNLGGENSRLYRTQRTAAILTEFTFPNVTMNFFTGLMPILTHSAGSGDSRIDIKPYLAARGSYVLQKQVGKEKYSIGQLNINHFLLFTGTQWQWENGAHNNYLYFYHPEQIQKMQANIQEELHKSEFRDTWEAMENLPEGTVSELSLSFWETYSIDQVITMLQEYDLAITWYAISTGLEESPGNNRDTNHPRPLSAFNGAWGLPHMSQDMLNQYNPIRTDDSSVREEYFMNSMKYLVENEKLGKKLYRGNSRNLHLIERYQYLQENGIQVYGVVVTGPTKELLKLQELEAVHSPALGDVELWNWFNRSFGGTMY